ncbi:MAG: flagellar biosynthetic protein FliR [Pseudomonadota bacterium]
MLDEFFVALAPLTELGFEKTAVSIGVFARISALAFFLPGLGERSVPMRIRLAAALGIALILTPFVNGLGPVAPTNISSLTLVIAAESVAGAIIGFSIRIAVYAIQIAGSMAAQTLSLSQLFAGIDDTPEPPIGAVLTLAAITLAVSAGLHFQAVKALAASYSVMPFGQFPGASDTGAWAVDRVAFAFSTAFTLALPFVVLGFVYNLAIGAANRAMPQLLVAFVGAPAITLGGFALLALAAPVILTTWMDLVDGLIETLIGGAL